MLPAVRDVEMPCPLKGCVREYNCEIRSRLGSLTSPGEDVWWDLDYLVAETAATVVETMRRAGIPFLNRFRNYSDVLSTLESDGALPSKNQGRSALVGALVCHQLGRREEARTWFDRAAAAAVSPPRPHKGFEAHVVVLRGKSGL